MFGLILLAIVVVLALWAIAVYNGLVVSRNAYKNAFAQIDVQLTRRYDLIPNLVEIAKGYMKHERETLEAVIQARNSAVSGLRAAAGNPGDPAAMQQLAGADNQLSQSLGRLFALSEAYPDLKANQNFAQLQRDLVQTEEQLQYARRFYNGAVRDYTDATQRVPDVLVAKATGFGPLEFFQADADSREAVRVELPR